MYIQCLYHYLLHLINYSLEINRKGKKTWFLLWNPCGRVIFIDYSRIIILSVESNAVYFIGFVAQHSCHSCLYFWRSFIRKSGKPFIRFSNLIFLASNECLEIKSFDIVTRLSAHHLLMPICIFFLYLLFHSDTMLVILSLHTFLKNTAFTAIGLCFSMSFCVFLNICLKPELLNYLTFCLSVF